MENTGNEQPAVLPTDQQVLNPGVDNDAEETIDSWNGTEESIDSWNGPWQSQSAYQPVNLTS